MSFDIGSLISEGPKNGPKMVCMYSVPGTGKSTACDKLPNAIFIPTEDNVDHIVSKKFPVAQTYDEALSYVDYLIQQQGGGFQYVIQDSISSLSNLAERKICDMAGVSAISDIQYGRGKEPWANLIKDYVIKLAQLKKFGCTVILTGHATITVKPDPEKVGEEYKQYTPKLLDLAIEYIKENCNAVLFVKKKDISVKKAESFGKALNAGVVTNERIMYTQEKGGAMAKCACNHMPEEWPLDLNSFFWYWNDPDGYREALEKQQQQ